jgi:hypothetical protein
MIITNYAPEDLKKLPLRAIVALSARCARRVEHLAVPEDDDPETQRCRAAVSNAIRLTEKSRAARRVRPQNPPPSPQLLKRSLQLGIPIPSSQPPSTIMRSCCGWSWANIRRRASPLTLHRRGSSVRSQFRNLFQ